MVSLRVLAVGVAAERLVEELLLCVAGAFGS
jgi:hypothetical protein